MTRGITVISEKGGVGKTTTATNLAVGLAEEGKRVLLLDFDQQKANASACLGLIELASTKGVYGSAEFVLGEGDFAPVRNVLVDGLDVLVAGTTIAALERRLFANLAGGNLKLAKAVRKVESQYDFIIADCGPTLGMMATNAIGALPEVLVPVELAPLPLMGAAQVSTFVEEVREGLQEKARIMGVLATFFVSDENAPKKYLAQARDIFGPLMFEAVIPRAAAVRDASGRGRPVLLDQPKHRASQQYRALIQEVLRRG